MVLIVSRRVGSAGVTSVRAGWGSWFVGWFWAFIVARVAGRASVVGTRRVMGSGGMVFSADKAAEVASMNQFFNFILECFTILGDMAMVSVIATIFSHVRVGGLSSCVEVG